MAKLSVVIANMNVVFVCILAYLGTVFSIPTNYNVGVGIADITGPAAEVDMMGYANPAQTSEGLHLRQFSRAFIVADPDTSTSVVYVNTDSCMLSQLVKLEVVRAVKKKYGNLYTERNICISGTHTHSGPGGFHEYILFDITSLGFVNETFQALKDGIIKSIERAHDNIQPANIYVNSGELLESNINRSPNAYLNNPKKERDNYNADVDKTMTVLKMVDANENPIGMLSWFAVHCTSMNNTNRLISSDNKGYASILFERLMNPGALPGKGKFVAAFGQSNEGDVSPNTKGPHCLDTGLACDFNRSTCNGRNEKCVAFGPGKDMFDSTRIIGENQFNKALQLFNEATEPLSGPVDFRHTYTDMSKQQVVLEDNSVVQTCKPAMGYSFAAGTTDGPGAFDFTQGTTKGNPFWDFISSLIKKPSKKQVACHKPKPILLDTGEMSLPYAWQPDVLDTQILRIGELIIIAVPAEFTTMSGRRTRNAVAAALTNAGFPDTPLPVIAGLANDYADYVTTFEEYQVQRYEGGSTVYGPHTLQAYIQVYSNLSVALAKGESVIPGPNPPDLMSKQLSFLPPVVYDEHPIGKKFGDCVRQPLSKYKPGQSVKVTFVGANPRNDRKSESTFLEVQFKEMSGNWTVEYTDAHWETRFRWRRTSTVLGHSEVDIQWDIPDNQKPGTYKISYYGNSKPLVGKISPFSGETKPFVVETSFFKKAKDFKKLQKWNKYFNIFKKAQTKDMNNYTL